MGLNGLGHWSNEAMVKTQRVWYGKRQRKEKCRNLSRPTYLM